MSDAFILVDDPLAANAVSVHVARPDTLDSTLNKLPAAAQAYAKGSGFSAISGDLLAVPDESGAICAYLAGLGTDGSAFHTGRLARTLPAGTYQLHGLPDHEVEEAHRGFALGHYWFTRYKSLAPDPDERPRLVLPETLDETRLALIADGAHLARDLINIPACDMGPEALEMAAIDLATSHGAATQVFTGHELLREDFPMIHAVGRAAASAPRLIDITWGEIDAPKLTLVGKGVTFDTGGLDLKPGNAMALMKKDMGGAANVLGLAHMIMEAQLPLRLRVLLPTVENAIGAGAFRPGDILRSRKGLTVEIGNTDAEGRLILADALAYGDEEAPELMIDLATLTGAARTALGPDMPPFYTNDIKLAQDLAQAQHDAMDALWQMPLYPPYDDMLSSKIADVNHIGSSPFAGSITAALFLQRFVSRAQSWLHIDIYGWTPKNLPECPEGGRDQAIRALFHMLEKRYGG